MKSERKPKIAVTGATGFIGRQFLEDCTASDLSVSALTRTSRQEEVNLTWVLGDLLDVTALSKLIKGVDCVVHLAGATKALRKGDFFSINTDATKQLAQICAENGVKHFVFLSSLAATRPSVSSYASSKSAAEAALSEMSCNMKITVIRAPAVLGPHDSATYPLFANLSKGFLPIPGPAKHFRFSIIDVVDLSKLLLSIACKDCEHEPLITPYGHESIGWQDVANSASRSLNRPIRQFVVPSPIIVFAGRATDIIARISGKAQVFSSEKLQEMKAGDWIASSPVEQPLALDETMKRCLEPFLNRGKQAA